MKGLIMCVLLFMTLSCSNRKEVMLNTAPQVTVGFSKDTVRVREKDWTNVPGTGNGKVTLYCGDPGHELNMQVDDTSSRVHILYRGNEIRHGQSLPVMDSVQLFIVADDPGLYEVSIWLRDRLGRVDKQKLMIKCLTNAAPVASFFWIDLGSQQLQSWNYLFDASNSIDSDGTITGYHFSVNGQPIVTNQPNMYWTFHAKGSHTIGLYVVDELGKSSDTLFQNLTIQ
jgi:hypothetical protein